MAYKFTPVDKPCLRCNEVFTPPSRRSTYCSPCKEVVYRERLDKVYAAKRDKTKRRTIECVTCSNVFTTVHTTKMTCSKECSHEFKKAQDRKIYADDPSVQIALNAKRRALQKQAVPSWADQDEIRYIYKLAKEKGLVVDHIVPIRHNMVCGLHTPDNLRCIPHDLNLVKSNVYWPDMADSPAKRVLRRAA